MAIFEVNNFKQDNNTQIFANKTNEGKYNSNDKLFEEITNRIENQSYSYTARNKTKANYLKDTYYNSSLFYDTSNNIYIPLFNYFDYTIQWYKSDIKNPIKLTKANNLTEKTILKFFSKTLISCCMNYKHFMVINKNSKKIYYAICYRN